MLRRIFQVSVVIALVVAVGGHWALLQSVAWLRMAVQYSKDAPLAVALQKTFDGRHPCKMCHAVEEGKKSEQQRESKKFETKPDFFCLMDGAMVSAPAAYPMISGAAVPLPVRSHSPPLPPPRCA